MDSADWKLASKCGILTWVKDTSRVELYSVLTPTLIVAYKTCGGTPVDYIKFSTVVSVRQEGTTTIVLEKKNAPLICLMADNAIEARHWFEAIHVAMTRYQPLLAPAMNSNSIGSSTSERPPLPTAERTRTDEQKYTIQDTRVAELNRMAERNRVPRLVQASEENPIAVQNCIADFFKEVETISSVERNITNGINKTKIVSDANLSNGMSGGTMGMAGMFLNGNGMHPQKTGTSGPVPIRDDRPMAHSKEIKGNKLSIERTALFRPPHSILSSVGTSHVPPKGCSFKEMPGPSSSEVPMLHKQVPTTANYYMKPTGSSLNASPFTSLKKGFTVGLQEKASPGYMPSGRGFPERMPPSMVPSLSSVDSKTHQREVAQSTGDSINPLSSQQESNLLPRVFCTNSYASDLPRKIEAAGESVPIANQTPFLIHMRSQRVPIMGQTSDVPPSDYACTLSLSGDKLGAQAFRPGDSLEKGQTRERPREKQNLAHSLHGTAIEDQRPTLCEVILDRLCNESVDAENVPTNEHVTPPGPLCSKFSVTSDIPQSPSVTEAFENINVHRRSGTPQTASQVSGSFVVDCVCDALLRGTPRSKPATALAPGCGATSSRLQSLECDNFYRPIEVSVSIVPRRSVSSVRSPYRRSKSVECGRVALTSRFDARELTPRRNSGYISDGVSRRHSTHFDAKRDLPLKRGYSPRFSPSRRRSPVEVEYVTGIAHRRDREMLSRGGDMGASHHGSLQPRSSHERRQCSKHPRRSTEREQRCRLAHEVLMEPRLVTKHDVRDCGSAKYYFCVTQDAKYVVCIPAEDYMRGGSVSGGTPFSLDETMSFYGPRCRAMAINNIDHVSLGTYEDFVLSSNFLRVCADRLVCLVSKTHAFLLEVGSYKETNNLVETWTTFLQSAQS